MGIRVRRAARGSAGVHIVVLVCGCGGVRGLLGNLVGDA
jgi:hypothetical protein